MVWACARPQIVLLLLLLLMMMMRWSWQFLFLALVSQTQRGVFQFGSYVKAKMFGTLFVQNMMIFQNESWLYCLQLRVSKGVVSSGRSRKWSEKSFWKMRKLMLENCRWWFELGRGLNIQTAMTTMIQMNRTVLFSVCGYPAVCGGFNPVRETLLGHHWLKVEVQWVPVHQSVMEDGLHVKLKPLNGHVVQVAGQLLWVWGRWQARSTVSVGVEGAEAPRHASPAEVAGDAIRHLHRDFGCRQTWGAPTVAQGHEQAAIHSFVTWPGLGCAHCVDECERDCASDRSLLQGVWPHADCCCMAAACSLHWDWDTTVSTDGMRSPCWSVSDVSSSFRSPAGQLYWPILGPKLGLLSGSVCSDMGGQGVHTCLSITTLAILLLRLWDHTGGAVRGVPRARLHHGRRGGLGGAWGCRPSANLRIVGREQVQVVQKVLHDILRAVSQRACHLRQAGQRGCHFGARGSWVAHMHVCLPEIVLRHEGWEAATQSAGVGARPRPEAVPRIKVIVAVGVGAARPLRVGAWALCASVRASLQGQLWGDRETVSHML